MKIIPDEDAPGAAGDVNPEEVGRHVVEVAGAAAAAVAAVAAPVAASAGAAAASTAAASAAAAAAGVAPPGAPVEGPPDPLLLLGAALAAAEDPSCSRSMSSD